MSSPVAFPLPNTEARAKIVIAVKSIKTPAGRICAKAVPPSVNQTIGACGRANALYGCEGFFQLMHVAAHTLDA